MSSGPEILDSEYFRKTAAILWRDRKIVIFATLIGTTLLGTVAFLIPPTYRARTTLIPVSTQSSLGALGQLGVGLEDLGLPIGVGNTQVSKYPEIVRSRRLLTHALLQRFPTRAHGDSILLLDLVQKGGTGEKRIEVAIRKLRSSIHTEVDRRNGILSINVDSTDPVVAAAVANELAGELQSFMIFSFTSQAGENRKFVESRLVDANKALAGAEEQLRQFRERNLRIGNSPQLQLEQGRLERAVREQEDVYLTLRRQFELARIQEHRDVPVINPLDIADPPVIRWFPKRGLTTLCGFVLGASVGMWLAFGRARVRSDSSS